MAQANKEKPSLRGLLYRRLIIIAIGVELVVFGVMFLVVYQGESARALSDMESEVSYQLQLIRAAKAVADEAVGGSDVPLDTKEPDEVAQDELDKFRDGSLLRGYTESSDGMIVIATAGGLVVETDSPRFDNCDTLSECFPSQTLDAIKQAIETGEHQRVRYAGGAGDASKNEAVFNAYLIARQDDGYIVVAIRSFAMMFGNAPVTLATSMILSAAVLFVAYAFALIMINRHVVRRAEKTSHALSRVAAGHLDTRVEPGETREFDALATDINKTVDALKGLIAEAETRMRAELSTARVIQQSALPGIFPPYPDIVKFDIYATMNAAREVGGDFYDFFLIGDSDPLKGKLVFVVADVSGKGVPAALFMMKAKSHIHDYLADGVEVGEAVEEANRMLYDGNDEGMFVTAWVGVLDYDTGHVEYVNAGHNPPLLWQREGGWSWVSQRSGPMLGLFEGMAYRSYSLDCQAGDHLLLYTDGVTEAFDTEEELYGEERLMAIVEQNYRLHPRQLVTAVREDVAKHAEGAEQSDDITLLALEVGVPPEITATLEVLAIVEELDRVNEFLHAELDRRLCPSRVQNQLDVAVEELFVNVCSYAYPDATLDSPGMVRVQRTYHAEPASITVDIIDEGIPFNPLEKPDTIMPNDITEVAIGGLGIQLTKKVVDEIKYEYVDGYNINTIVKRW